MKYKFFTSLNKEYCKIIIQQHTDQDIFSKKEFAGEVKGDRIMLQVKEIRNPYAKMFRGTLRSVENGTIIEGDFDLNTKILKVFFSIIPLFMLYQTLIAKTISFGYAIYAILLFGAISGLFIAIDAPIGKQKIEYIVKFMERELEATRIDT